MTHTFPASSVTVLEFRLAAQESSVGDALRMSDNTAVVLQDLVVAGVFSDRFYAQEADRSAGIAVQRVLGDNPSIGDSAMVRGILTTVNGERVVQYADVEEFTPGTSPDPIAMPNRSLGGGSLSVYTAGIPDAPDVYNIGLLVWTSGVVTHLDNAGFLYLDDGSALSDGSGYCGVKVLEPPDDWPAGLVEEDYLAVTGISSSSMPNSVVVRTLRARSEEEVHIVGSGTSTCGQQMSMSNGMMSRLTAEPAEGTIDYALAQSDGTKVSLEGVQITGDLGDMFGVKQPSESLAAEPRLVAECVATVKPLWTIDVTGVIGTLSTGQRSIVPTSILLYTDASGRPAPPPPTTLDLFGTEWPWKSILQ
jgi:uncharacterized protein YdeI (BOF family)